MDFKINKVTKIFKKVAQKQLFNCYSLQNRSKIRNFTLARALLKMPKPHLSTVTITIDTRDHRLLMSTLQNPHPHTNTIANKNVNLDLAAHQKSLAPPLLIRYHGNSVCTDKK